ncbi:hypothetical protein JTE90_021225 [Oedothorax gibbosus]|uniref:CID domain-containing protein n=1 Tax=Oedothorax gibbosus TaxID=931172 RepID=A0AAV6UVJ1_9ARAC|nr:hypothetical protein JTE90_021225 [Oedothorax gibbosus]
MPFDFTYAYAACLEGMRVFCDTVTHLIAGLLREGMTGFTDVALEKKLHELNNSQQSIQTLSLWLVHHRKHHRAIVHIWLKELNKAKDARKLTFMYLANDVIQISKKKGPEFSKEFSSVLGKAFAHVCENVSDAKTRSGLERIISVWEDRNVYEAKVIAGLRAAMRAKKSPPKKAKKRKTPEKETPPPKKKSAPVKKEEAPPSPHGEPPEPEDLIQAIQDLDNSPSTDAVVREKIAQFPPEVSDVTLLDKITNRAGADRLRAQVEEASTLLTAYNARLHTELEDRKKLSRMLHDYTHHQREALAQHEKKLEEFREQLRRVSQVRSELKSHLQNLPDLTLLPSVTGGLAPLPSAGDLFQ